MGVDLNYKVDLVDSSYVDGTIVLVAFDLVDDEVHTLNLNESDYDQFQEKLSLQKVF